MTGGRGALMSLNLNAIFRLSRAVGSKSLAQTQEVLPKKKKRWVAVCHIRKCELTDKEEERDRQTDRQ